MNSLIIKRGLKNVPSFKNLSKRLVRNDQLKRAKPFRIEEHVKVKEPLTFKDQLKTSSLIPKENDLENEANKFLDFAANQLNPSDENEVNWDEAMQVIQASEREFPAEPKDVAKIMEKPGVKPFFNLASIANDAPTLQRLVDLGTKISKWEKSGHLEMAMTLDFNRDVVPRIYFLIDNGLKPEELGQTFTENPDLFLQDLDDLQVRINYLKHHKFTKDQIKHIIRLSDSRWLNFSVFEIDAKLGFICKLFCLQDHKLRQVTSTCPNLVLWEGTPSQLENNYLAMKDWMGFSKRDLGTIIARNPEMFMAEDTDTIQDKFDILHNEIGYPHKLLVPFAEALSGDLQVMKVRLKLLKKLGMDQFDPTKPAYVNPEAFALYEDAEFCQKVAKIPVSLYNKFLRVV